jgi:hypothetical protein
MKDYIGLYGLPVVLALSMAYAPGISAEVYKTVDEDGNVVYTDQAPDPDAKPIELPGLSIISPQRPATPPPAPDAKPRQKEASIMDLRRAYSDFTIVSPNRDQTFWGTANETTVTWRTRRQLLEGMSVTVYVDGVAQAPTTDSAIIVDEVFRGEHEVYAVLNDARDRTIASTDPIAFYVRQNSVNFRARQAGGG